MHRVPAERTQPRLLPRQDPNPSDTRTWISASTEGQQPCLRLGSQICLVTSSRSS